MAASLLDLPPELRLCIYEILTWDHNIYLSDGNEEHGVVRNAFALSQVCSLIRHEVLPVLPTLSNIILNIDYHREESFHEWLDAMGPERILQVRKLVITGSAICHMADDMSELQ